MSRHIRLSALVLVLVMGLAACGVQKLPDGCPPACSGLYLYSYKLSTANLANADLSKADLTHAVLKGTNLSGANLQGALLPYTDLAGANLTNADLRGADLRFSKLKAVDLTGANLEGAILLSATYRPSTKWPEGFDYRAAGAVMAPTD